ncbi:MAG: PAAR domain-containing protein, partial [Bacteroidota bacterium]
MIGAKHMDPVLGVDIHIILVPTPAGPVPTPIPHPFVGMVFDPMDLVPIVGATVMVNGMPVGVAGTGAKNIPPHIPIGGPFGPPPPGNEGEIFMGSATVLADGEPFSYTGLPVLSCSSVGAPAPPRAKKGGGKSLMLPTSVVLSVPMGMPVLVGGPPTISLMGMAMKFGFAAH